MSYCAIPDEFSADPIIRKSAEYIQRCYMTDVSLDSVARYVCLSREYFCTYFKRVTGRHFFDVLNAYRIQKAEELLRTGSIPIASVARQVGYKSISHFYRAFRKYNHLTPARYRKQFCSSR